MSDDVQITKHLVVPARELEWRFDPSGGPGGQHANRSATRVELRWNIAASDALPDDVKSRVVARLGKRITDGVLSVVADDTRSQYRNRVNARRRLAALVADAALPVRRRRRTAVPRSAKKRRREAKARRAETKRLRRPPRDE